MKRGREEFDRRILRRATDHAALVDRFQWIFLPRYEYPLLIQHSHGIDGPSMVYLLKMVIFHGYVSHNQRVSPSSHVGNQRGIDWLASQLEPKLFALCRSSEGDLEKTWDFMGFQLPSGKLT